MYSKYELYRDMKGNSAMDIDVWDEMGWNSCGDVAIHNLSHASEESVIDAFFSEWPQWQNVYEISGHCFAYKMAYPDYQTAFDDNPGYQVKYFAQRAIINGNCYYRNINKYL